MIGRDWSHLTKILPPKHKNDIKTRYKGSFQFREADQSLSFAMYRDLKKIKSNVPCMFFYQICTSSQLKEKVTICDYSKYSCGEREVLKILQLVSAYHKSVHHSKVCLPVQSLGHNSVLSQEV